MELSRAEAEGELSLLLLFHLLLFLTVPSLSDLLLVPPVSPQLTWLYLGDWFQHQPLKFTRGTSEKQQQIWGVATTPTSPFLWIKGK